jgi:hypothetical protein
MAAFALGTRVLGRFHNPRAAFVLGSICSVSYIAGGSAFGWFERAPNVLVPPLFLLAVSVIAASAGRRIAKLPRSGSAL